MGLGTVHEYLERAAAAGIGRPLPKGLGEEELEAKLFGNHPVRVKAVRQRPQPDWKGVDGNPETRPNCFKRLVGLSRWFEPNRSLSCLPSALRAVAAARR